jgi:spore coat polysaccharide biosynthesis predicted glycosyltransferase SpsG/CMP-N-acetylneuraminic acid synthetase
VPRKNVRLLAGRPLIHHVLETLNTIAVKERIIVSTDDAEIALLASEMAIVHNRAQETASPEATLDQVGLEVAQWILKNGGKENDILFTVQPTSPFITKESIKKAIDVLQGDSIASVVSVKDDRHLRWTTINGVPKPLFEARVNRQWMDPVYAETGGIICVGIGTLLQTKTRINEPVALVELAREEALDIDNHDDWAVAEFIASRRKIIIRADASRERGMGHVYRAAALATEWAAHDVIIATVSPPEGIGAIFVHNLPTEGIRFDTEEMFERWLANQNADLMVYDILDTTAEQIQQGRNIAPCVVTFEDSGPGAVLADIVVNDLYPSLNVGPTRQLVGIQNAILAPTFESIPPRRECPERIERVLVTFGGTDPSDLTSLAIEALQDLPVNVEVVLGPGYSGKPPQVNPETVTIHRNVDNMAILIRQADLAITSAGRTVTEVLSMGVIPIVLCQNTKELTHTHASGVHGVLNQGLGKAVDVEALRAHIRLLMNDIDLRRILWERGRHATSNRSNAAVCSRILEIQKECANIADR